MFAFYFPDPKRRARVLPWYLRNVLRCALRYGDAYTTAEIAGVVFTLPPGQTRLSIPEYIRNGFLLSPFLLGFKNYKRSMDCERFVGDLQETLMKGQPHVYLWGLAVAPGHQNRGIGSALMMPVLAAADCGHLPVYLETHDEQNVAYYRRAGFRLLETARMSKYNLRVWAMLRSPRTDRATD